MPFGKFFGKKICNLPSSYLRWVAENVKEDTDQNKKVVELCDKEYQFRERYNCHK